MTTLKTNFFILLCTVIFFYIPLQGKPTIAWKQKSYIGLRAQNRISCGIVQLKLKDTLPLPPSEIEVISFKYDTSTPGTIYRKGSCLLSEFPHDGIKFDRPAWRKSVFYQIRFAPKHQPSSRKQEFYAIDDIIAAMTITPVQWCVSNAVSFAPLNLSTTITTGEGVALATTAVIVVAGTGFALHQRAKKHQQISPPPGTTSQLPAYPPLQPLHPSQTPSFENKTGTQSSQSDERAITQYIEGNLEFLRILRYHEKDLSPEQTKSFDKRRARIQNDGKSYAEKNAATALLQQELEQAITQKLQITQTPSPTHSIPPALLGTLGSPTPQQPSDEKVATMIGEFRKMIPNLPSQSDQVWIEDELHKIEKDQVSSAQAKAEALRNLKKDLESSALNAVQNIIGDVGEYNNDTEPSIGSIEYYLDLQNPNASDVKNVDYQIFFFIQDTPNLEPHEKKAFSSRLHTLSVNRSLSNIDKIKKLAELKKEVERAAQELL